MTRSTTDVELPELPDPYYWVIKRAHFFGDEVILRREVRLFGARIGYSTVDRMIPLADSGRPKDNIEWGASRLWRDHMTRQRNAHERAAIRYGRR